MSRVPLKTLIVDDEEHCRTALERIISEHCPQLRVTDSVHSVASARRSIYRQKPDLVFLDVEMPEEDGFDLIDELDAETTRVIFTTAHGHYALKALKNRALDYLLKPIQLKELLASLRKLEEKPGGRQKDEMDRVALPTLKGLVFCEPGEIIRCQADGAYTQVFRKQGSLLVSRNIGQLEELLRGKSFFRVHKSHLINLQHAREYIRGSGGFVVMSDGTQVEVSKRKREDFLLAAGS